MSAMEKPAGHKPFTAEYWVGKFDLRPIALFRFFFGLFLFYDLCDLLPNLRFWFSNEGVLPLPAFIGQWARVHRFSLLDSFSTVPMVHVYWVLASIAVLCMALGYRSRLASVASFIFLAGFQERLPPLFDGSDTVIRMVLFWHMFVPSNRVWSVDALLAEKRGRPMPKVGSAVFVRLLQLQIALIYLITAFHKIQGSTWRNGDALHYVLHLNHVFSRPWALIAADNAFLMAVGTYFTLVMEFGFILFANFPVLRLHKPMKVAAILTAYALHFGIAASVNVGLFSYLMPLTMFLFWEPEWVQLLVDKVSAFLGPARIARARALFEAFPAPQPLDPPLSSYFSELTLARMQRVGGMAVVAWFAICSWYAIPKYMQPPLGPVQRPIELAVQALDVWSSWDMFSPEPLRTDYHLTAPAEYDDGSTGNLFGGDANGPGEDRGFWFTRWFKYAENVTGGDQTLPLEWGRFLCRERNFHPELGSKLYTFTLFKDDQVIPPIGQPWPPVARRTVWIHRCYDKPTPQPGRPAANNPAISQSQNDQQPVMKP